jgi:putative oxidoreductase
MRYAIPELLARVLLAQFFLFSGISKITGHVAAQAHMEAYGVEPILLPLVVLVEVLGALLLMVGWAARPAALMLTIYAVATALVFHGNFSQEMQTVQFMKNMSIAGGMLALYVHGAGPLSADALRHRLK